MEDWVTIRNLKKKDPNLGTRTIALMLGISRNTVKKALASDELPLYNRGEKKINEAVEPFIDFIKESFLKKNLKASRILKDIKSKGYRGSQYALYAYIREILKPIANSTPTHNAISACPRKYRFMLTSTSSARPCAKGRYLSGISLIHPSAIFS